MILKVTHLKETIFQDEHLIYDSFQIINVYGGCNKINCNLEQRWFNTYIYIYFIHKNLNNYLWMSYKICLVANLQFKCFDRTLLMSVIKKRCLKNWEWTTYKLVKFEYHEDLSDFMKNDHINSPYMREVLDLFTLAKFHT